MRFTEKSTDYVSRRKKPIPMAIEPKDLIKSIHRINKLDSMHRWELTAFSSFLYLSGARISEGIDIKRNQIQVRSEDLMVINIKTLKSRIYPLRKIPISPVKTDEPFFRIFKTFIDENTSRDENDYLFNFSSRNLVNKYFKKIVIPDLLQLDPQNRTWIEENFSLHPHYLRHCRLSHLASIFDFNEIQLMKFAGWTSTKPAVFYIKLSYKDLLKKMVSPNVATEYINKYLGSDVNP